MAEPLGRYVMLDGEIVPWEEGKIHVSCHGFLYGTGVFEGIRAYWNEARRQLYVFELERHMDRLVRNVRILGLPDPPGRGDLVAWALDLLRANEVREDAYIRPVVFAGEGTVAVRFTGQRTRSTMITLPVRRFFRKGGLRCMVTSWRRVSNSALPPMGKFTGAYVNSVLATMEAHRFGFDEAIVLTAGGLVSEGAAANLFLVRDGKLATPTLGHDILEGITRRHVFEMAEDLGIEAEERAIPRPELYIADEVFLCGTGAEILPVVEIDKRPVGTGEAGGVATKLADRFFKTVRGDVSKYEDKLTPVWKNG
jgi:branched-chain amino acid aminotransferase